MDDEERLTAAFHALSASKQSSILESLGDFVSWAYDILGPIFNYANIIRTVWKILTGKDVSIEEILRLVSFFFLGF